MRKYKVIVEAKLELNNKEAQDAKINLELVTEKMY
jgi:hypothetical protein